MSKAIIERLRSTTLNRLVFHCKIPDKLTAWTKLLTSFQDARFSLRESNATSIIGPSQAQRILCRSTDNDYR